MGSQCSDESLPNASPAKKPGHCAEADGRDTKDTKGTEEKDSETEMSKEPPTRPPSQSPLKKRPTSTRPSAETFRSLVIDDDDCKSKKSSLSVGDSSSIYTIDSNDERRLSDKVKKAWRGVTGQKQAVDPLERWMATHSGGTLKDMPVGRSGGESSERR